MIANRWIEQGYNACLVLHSVGLASSTYYAHKARQPKKMSQSAGKSEESKRRAGRPILGYSYTYTGRKISDEQIKEFIMEELSAMGILMAIKSLRPACKRTMG